MAKKAAPKPQLVHIPATGSAPLSKPQKEFNRLTKRIATLEKDVSVFRAAVDRLRQRVQTEYRPLQNEHNRVRAGLVRQLDQAFDTYKLTKGERSKIAEIIGNQCFDLLDKGHPDLKPIIDRHAPPPSEEEAADIDQAISEAMKGFYSQQFGIEFDPEADVSTQEKFQTYVARRWPSRKPNLPPKMPAKPRVTPAARKPPGSKPPRRKSWPRSAASPKPCAASTSIW